AAVAERAANVLATVALGDDRTRRHVEAAFGVTVTHIDPAEGDTSLDRLQLGLFDETARKAAALDERVIVLSAPGEARECVEIARIAQREADRGVAFDCMAILLRAPAQYRPHVEEALRRAGIPAHFVEGVRQPDPAGRALLALLGCAAENLSARRFA